LKHVRISIDLDAEPRIFTDLTDQRIATANTSLSSQTPVNVLTNVINQYMSSTIQVQQTNRRTQMVDRHNGQSLTTTEVLTQLEEKEKKRKSRILAKNASADCIPRKR